MSTRLLKDTKFKSIAKKFFKKNKESLLDIIFFGSAVKGKEKPGDIDILLLFKDRKDIDVSYHLKKELQKAGFNAEITDKSYAELFDNAFIAKEAILSESYSLIYEQFIADGLGYLNFILFKYELTGFNKSQRMRFYYSLYGRSKDQQGTLKTLNVIKFSDSVFLCPVENAEKMKEYLLFWSIKFNEFPILLPSRLKAVL